MSLLFTVGVYIMSLLFTVGMYRKFLCYLQLECIEMSLLFTVGVYKNVFVIYSWSV